MPQIDIPRFRFGDKQRGGVGQGDGEPAIRAASEGEGRGTGQGRRGARRARLEVESRSTSSPRSSARSSSCPHRAQGQERSSNAKDRYTGIRRVRPRVAAHFKRTYKRGAASGRSRAGTYDPTPDHRPGPRRQALPLLEDRRRAAVANAVIIYMMDVSGSMGDEQKEIVRIESFWIDTWLRSQYKGLESRYIIHDATAREVDRDTFFRTRESGGTMISSAYKLCARSSRRLPAEEWNIYPFHFSDGDNWSMDDT
jgi:uncharacterized protein